eukprot:m.1273088 g.1273088  ORF g.1273088 m.1273088 type:complete len:400 (-) comp24751_c0_seq59:3566-4765(-)
MADSSRRASVCVGAFVLGILVGAVILIVFLGESGDDDNSNANTVSSTVQLLSATVGATGTAGTATSTIAVTATSTSTTTGSTTTSTTTVATTHVSTLAGAGSSMGPMGSIATVLPTTTSVPSFIASGSSEDSSSSGETAGIAAGAFFGCLFLSLIVVFILRRKHAERSQQGVQVPQEGSIPQAQLSETLQMNPMLPMEQIEGTHTKKDSKGAPDSARQNATLSSTQFSNDAARLKQAQASGKGDQGHPHSFGQPPPAYESDSKHEDYKTGQSAVGPFPLPNNSVQQNVAHGTVNTASGEFKRAPSVTNSNFPPGGEPWQRSQAATSNRQFQVTANVDPTRYTAASPVRSTGERHEYASHEVRECMGNECMISATWTKWLMHNWQIHGVMGPGLAISESV